MRRYASNWARNQSSCASSAFVPLSFAPGEACQFDRSHEVVVIDGTTTTIKVAHVRLCHSGMFFVRAYPRETRGTSAIGLEPMAPRWLRSLISCLAGAIRNRRLSC